MIRFLIDEDIARSTALALINAGFECLDIRDIGLKGAADEIVFKRAQEEGCILITEDLGFSNTLRYPLGSHKGIVIARFPNKMATSALNAILIPTIESISEDIPGNLTIIEPHKVRIRRK